MSWYNHLLINTTNSYTICCVQQQMVFICFSAYSKSKRPNHNLFFYGAPGKQVSRVILSPTILIRCVTIYLIPNYFCVTCANLICFDKMCCVNLQRSYGNTLSLMKFKKCLYC